MNTEHEISENFRPSGHCNPRLIPSNQIVLRRCNESSFINCENQLQKDDFSGPYKDFNPPGSRTPAVGEKIWGDPPYLPSYIDRMYVKESPEAPPDNLYFRGPFYKGASETHTEFVNHEKLQPRKFNKYVRHYIQPGMRDTESVTHADFQSPLPMLRSDRSPYLKETEKSWYDPEPKKFENPHAKEVEYQRKETEVMYVSEGYKRDFSTEHNDNYVCFMETKKGSKIKDLAPIQEEEFLKNTRKAHRNCNHQNWQTNFCDDSCRVVREQCPGPTPQSVTWLMQPKENYFQNGVMILPCRCRYDSSMSKH